MITFRAFALRLLGLLGLLAVPAWLILQYNQPESLGIGVGSLVFGAALTLAGFSITQPGLLKPAIQFMNALLGAMGLKMLVSIAFVTTMALLQRAHVVPLVICYFSGYLVFTGFEVWALLNNLRANSKAGGSAGT